MSKLTHLDESGTARMVDVGEKPVTERVAQAQAAIWMRNATLDLIESHEIVKGDVFAVARIAGIMAAKRTAELIPLCHPLALTVVDIDVSTHRTEQFAEVRLKCVAKTRGQTGVEMEALTGASIAALTVYDMCKSADREMEIAQIFLAEKSGGRSGHFVHPKLKRSPTK